MTIKTINNKQYKTHFLLLFFILSTTTLNIIAMDLDELPQNDEPEITIFQKIKNSSLPVATLHVLITYLGVYNSLKSPGKMSVCCPIIFGCLTYYSQKADNCSPLIRLLQAHSAAYSVFSWGWYFLRNRP